MNKLTIEKMPCTRAMDTMRISGFAEGELEKLKQLPNEAARSRLLDILDTRNNGLATRWHNGEGIYGLWFDNEYAYLNIGRSCD